MKQTNNLIAMDVKRLEKQVYSKLSNRDMSLINVKQCLNYALGLVPREYLVYTVIDWILNNFSREELEKTVERLDLEDYLDVREQK